MQYATQFQYITANPGAYGVHPCAPLAIAASHCDAWRQLGMGSPRGSLALRGRVYGRGELAGPSHWKWWQSADASPECAEVVPTVLSHSAGPSATADRGDPAHHRGTPPRPGAPTARKAVAHLACAPIADRKSTRLNSSHGSI